MAASLSREREEEEEEEEERGGLKWQCDVYRRV